LRITDEYGAKINATITIMYVKDHICSILRQYKVADGTIYIDGETWPALYKVNNYGISYDVSIEYMDKHLVLHNINPPINKTIIIDVYPPKVFINTSIIVEKTSFANNTYALAASITAYIRAYDGINTAYLMIDGKVLIGNNTYPLIIKEREELDNSTKWVLVYRFNWASIREMILENKVVIEISITDPGNHLLRYHKLISMDDIKYLISTTTPGIFNTSIYKPTRTPSQGLNNSWETITFATGTERIYKNNKAVHSIEVIGYDIVIPLLAIGVLILDLKMARCR